MTLLKINKIKMTYKLVTTNQINYLLYDHRVVTYIPNVAIHLEEDVGNQCSVRIGFSECILSRVSSENNSNVYDVIEITYINQSSKNAIIGGSLGVLFAGPIGGAVGAIIGFFS